jgi:hypothetical protein
MANDSAKKAAIESERLKNKYSQVLIRVYVFYFVFHICYGWNSFGFVDLCLFLQMSSINYFTFKQIVERSATGQPISIPQDILIVNLAVQLGSVFSNYACLLYLSIPGYVIWKFWPVIKNRLFAGTNAESESESEAGPTPQELKKQLKVERQRKRQFAQFGQASRK